MGLQQAAPAEVLGSPLLVSMDYWADLWAHMDFSIDQGRGRRGSSMMVLVPLEPLEWLLAVEGVS